MIAIVAASVAVGWWTYELPVLVTPVAVAAGAAGAIWAGRRAGRHWVTSGRYRVPPAGSVPEITGPMVLYLRPFALDEPAGANSSHGMSLFRSEEQQLGRAFREFGRLVAVGRPGEALPPVGAHRIYPGDAWRARVEELVRSAALVVVGAGRGAGLRWELELIGRIHDPRRTVILLPGAVDAVRRILAEIDGILPKPLPPAPRLLPRTGGVYTAAIHFAEDWTGRLVCFDKDGPGRSLTLECRRAVAPVFRAAGYQGVEQADSLRRESSVILYWVTVVVTLAGLALLLWLRTITPA